MSVKPRMLVLFCGAGGDTKGYQRAGFYVVGVDINPQPHYCGDEFFQADATTFPLDDFDAIHAGPPCNDHSQLHTNYGSPEHGTGWMLQYTLDRLEPLSLPWVVENVASNRKMRSPIELCGASFGLGASGLDLNRHRRFQSNVAMLAPPCQHRRGLTIGVYGNGTNKWHREKLGRNLTVAEQREAMGIDWMTRAELVQAIPPAYTEWIGRQLIDTLTSEATAC